MKLAVLFACALVVAEPIPEVLESGLQVVRIDAGGKRLDFDDLCGAAGERLSATQEAVSIFVLDFVPPPALEEPSDPPEPASEDPSDPPALTSNLSPTALQLDPAIPQYHAAEGVPEASRVAEAERGDRPPLTRIVGGLASYVGEHPFVGGLIITLLNGQTSICGSSLLTSNKVVTTAHCWHDGVDTAYSILVVLGSTRLFSGGVRVYASTVTAHWLYVPGIRTNDIALLTIPAVAFSSAVKPIAIATGDNSYTGYRAEAIGFGRTYDSAPITDAASLRDVFVTVISNPLCANYYGSVVDSAIICTDGAGGRNPCGGDSGGPLILYSAAGNDVLIGIINFHSTAGCQSGAPGGYVRVSYHAPWLIANA